MFAGLSWQIHVAYFIVTSSILAMLILGVIFARRVHRRRKKEKRQREVCKQHKESIRQIMQSGELGEAEIRTRLGLHNGDYRKFRKDAPHFLQILVNLRIEASEAAYIPNLVKLSTLLGVRELAENNLLKGRDVFETLQALTMLQLPVTEGKLANYVNHKNREIRMMSRLMFMISSTSDPYKYLLDELNDSPSHLKRMLLHYILGWKQSQGMQMPSFIPLIEKTPRDATAAFLIDEITFYGTDEERQATRHFLSTDNPLCKTAVIRKAPLFDDDDTYRRLRDLYPHQPEEIKRAILHSLAARRADEHTAFFRQCYHDSFSRETKEVALRCLYISEGTGRREFEMIRQNSKGEERTLMDKIDSMELLNTLLKL